MGVPAGLRARDPGSAARSAAGLTAFSGLLLVPWALFLPPRLDLGPLLACVVTGLLLIAASVGLRRLDAARLDRAGLLTAVPVLGSLVVGASNFLTQDSSAAAQVFLVVPVLLGATQLRTPGALLASGLGVLLSAAVTVTIDPSMQGITDAVVVGSAMLAITVVLAHSADRRDRAFAVVHQQATADGLTGLLSRRAVDEVLVATLSRGPTALLVVDVDRFKEVNDCHGHLVGDDALVHLAAVLRGQMRRTECVVGRLGGDELAVVLPGCDADTLGSRAQQLVTAVREAPLVLADGVLPLTISVGAAHAASPTTTPRDLYAAADEALYQVKRAGRDGFAVASA